MVGVLVATGMMVDMVVGVEVMEGVPVDEDEDVSVGVWVIDGDHVGVVVPVAVMVSVKTAVGAEVTVDV